jgi:amidohydrolase
MNFEQPIKDIETQVIEWRRTLHRHPELSFQERWTSDYIADQLSQMENITIKKPTDTSVLGIIKGGKSGRKIGLRADIDGLPILEERADIDFVSENEGVMHACGHDAHVAMLLGAAKVLSDHQEDLHGEIYLIFQHAEEVPPGGAIEMVNTGMLDDLEFIFGQHIFTPIEEGRIGIKSGPIMANSDTFDLTITGRGGHAAIPEDSVDPVIVGTKIITHFQDIVSRMASPLDNVVISTTNFHAGTAKNIIPETATLEGSVRTISDEMRTMVQEKMEIAVQAVCDFYGAEYDFHFDLGYDSLVNDEPSTKQVKEILLSHFGAQVFEYPLELGGEDFSAFSSKIPELIFI